MCLCFPTPGTAVSVHIPLCWVHWHSNYLQHNSSSGHSASAHACAKVLLLGRQPRRQQRHHTTGPWWAYLAFWGVFFSRSQAKFFCGGIWFDLIWVVVYIKCFPFIWRLIQVKLCVLERKSLRMNQSQSLCAVTSLLSKVASWNGSSSPTFEMTHPHMEACLSAVRTVAITGDDSEADMPHQYCHPLGCLVWVLGLWNLGQ